MSIVKTLRIGTAVLIAAGLLCVTQVSASFRSGSVRLASGSVPKFRWWVNVHRGGAPQVPCLHIELVHTGKRSPLEIELGETSCRPVSPLPNALGVVDELDHPKVTVIGMAFPEAARTVSLYFQGGIDDRTLPLKQLSEFKVQKAGLRPFRYFAIAFQGDSCLTRFVTHDNRERVLYDGGRMRCRVHR